MYTKRLSELEPGDSGNIVEIQTRGAIGQRLLDMGLLPKTHLELERIAPTGDPLWIMLQGSQLSLRKHEAERIVVNIF